jgi:hypothetical protein
MHLFQPQPADATNPKPKKQPKTSPDKNANSTLLLSHNKNFPTALKTPMLGASSPPSFALNFSFSAFPHITRMHQKQSYRLNDSKEKT